MLLTTLAACGIAFDLAIFSYTTGPSPEVVTLPGDGHGGPDYLWPGTVQSPGGEEWAVGREDEDVRIRGDAGYRIEDRQVAHRDGTELPEEEGLGPSDYWIEASRSGDEVWVVAEEFDGGDVWWLQLEGEAWVATEVVFDDTDPSAGHVAGTTVFGETPALYMYNEKQDRHTLWVPSGDTWTTHSEFALDEQEDLLAVEGDSQGVAWVFVDGPGYLEARRTDGACSTRELAVMETDATTDTAGRSNEGGEFKFLELVTAAEEGITGWGWSHAGATRWHVDSECEVNEEAFAEIACQEPDTWEDGWSFGDMGVTSMQCEVSQRDDVPNTWHYNWFFEGNF